VRVGYPVYAANGPRDETGTKFFWMKTASGTTIRCMNHAAGKLALALLVWAPAEANDEPPGVLSRFLERVSADLSRLPDNVCTFRLDRFARGMTDGPWKQVDSVTLTVGLAHGSEVYGRIDGGAAANLAEDGVFSTGQFAQLARHVFTWEAAKFGYRGESERAGRKAHEYEFDVPKAQSTYRLRMGNTGEIVAFQGSFHVDAESLDLLELEVMPYDIPERIGLARADTKLSYRRTSVRGAEALLPATATLQLATVDGIERMNRATFSGCRRFEAESTLRAEVPPDAAAAPSPVTAARLAPGLLLEVELDVQLDPKSLKPGDPIRARLAKAVEIGDGRIVPAGAPVHGAVARLREEQAPFPLFEIGLAFTSVETEGAMLPLNATMVDVEAERGIIRRSKRMDPTFSRTGKPKLDVLVGEVQKGQGIILWDARRTTVPKGLRMKWRVSKDQFD